MVGQCGDQNFKMKYNLDKNAFKTHKEFVRHNEMVRKKNHSKHIENKSFGSLATIERFEDAENLRRKVYRRASAKLISRMFNDILVCFNGTFIQKARQRIKIITSQGTIILKNSNTRKFGLNKAGESLETKFKSTNWEVDNKNCNLSMSQLMEERGEISNYLSSKYKRIKALPRDSLKHNSCEKYLFKWEDKKEIVFNTITPKFDKLDSILKTQAFQNKTILSKGIENYSNPYQMKSKVITKGKAKIKKDLPNAKSFNSINPDGTLKKIKTIYQSKRRFL